MPTQFSTHIPTLLSTDRICNLIKYSNLLQNHGGYFAEFGVFSGGSLEILARHNANTEILAFDSFEGLPQPSDKDYHNKGDFRDVNVDNIVGYFKMIYPRVRIVKGFSPKVFQLAKSQKFSFVHVDADLYQSVLDALNFFVPRMLTGGMILLDDYRVESTPGCEEAIDDYFGSNPEVSHREELRYHAGQNAKSHYQYLIVV